MKDLRFDERGAIRLVEAGNRQHCMRPEDIDRWHKNHPDATFETDRATGYCEIEISLDGLESLCTSATWNKSKKAQDGPILVHFIGTHKRNHVAEPGGEV